MQNSVFRHTIKYLGISSYTKFKNSNFKLFDIPYSIKLNSDNFDINNISQVSCNIDILNYKIIKTPKGTSFEGSILTGNKVFFKGIINFNIQYTSYNKSSQLYSHSSERLFVEHIELPSNYLNHSNIISISPTIIDISTIKISNREIFLTLVNYISIHC